MKIKDKEINLNSVIEVVTDNKKTMKLIVGRVYKWNNRCIWLDISDDLESLDKVVVVKIKDIYRIRKMNYPLWR